MSTYLVWIKRCSQGVGIALSPPAVAAWVAAGSEQHNDLGARVLAIRLLMTDCCGNDVGLFVISAYAPVGNAAVALWQDFFDKLETCISRKRRDDILLIGADTNSSMGILGHFGLPHINDSGRRFSSYLGVNDLLALTTRFKKHSYCTWTHPRSKLPHQIDHIISDNDNFCRFTDAGTTEPLIDSDHRAVRCKLRIMLRLRKAVSPRQRLARLDFSSLTENRKKESFCNEVLKEYNATDTNEPRYSRLEKALKRSAQTELPLKAKAQPGWFTAAEGTLLPLINARNQAMKRQFDRHTRSHTKTVKATRKALKSAVSKAKNDWILSQSKTANDAKVGKGGTKQCWDAVNKLKHGLSKTKPSTERAMKKEDGSVCKTPEENAEVFRAHFEKLYGRTPEFDLSILNSLHQHPLAQDSHQMPNVTEIREAVQNLKNRAPGESGIPPQALKAIIDNEDTFDVLRLVVQEFWESEVTPKEWEVGLLKILAKKGDLSKADNYRGIMLLEAAYKVIAIIIHKRLLPIEESLDHESQCGFRPQRGCADAIFTVKLALKKRREHGLETWVLFLDLVKAFDRVPREMLWAVLKKFGVPPKLVSLIESLHSRVQVKFTVNEITHEIQCIIGVKQGDVLGPILFTFLLAAVMITWRHLHNRPLCLFHTKMDDVLTGRRPGCKSGEEFAVHDSEYADDTAVLFTSRECVEHYVPLMIVHFAKFGMEIHVGKPDKESKSEILFVAAPRSTYVDQQTYDGRDLSNLDLGDGVYMPVVARVKYLGSILTRDCTDNEDVTARIESASHAFGALRHCLFTSANISPAVKRVVYEGLILAILLYGAETWSLTEKLFRQLRVFHAACIRSMCRVNRIHTRAHRITTVSLLDRLGLLSVDAYVTKKQLRWAGHVIRMNKKRLPRKMMTSWVSSKRPRGAPNFTYGRGVYKALKKVDIPRKGWAVLAMDREAWRDTINTLN